MLAVHHSSNKASTKQQRIWVTQKRHLDTSVGTGESWRKASTLVLKPSICSPSVTFALVRFRTKQNNSPLPQVLLWMEVLLTDGSTACWGVAVQDNPGRSEEEIIQQWLDQRRTCNTVTTAPLKYSCQHCKCQVFQESKVI